MKTPPNQDVSGIFNSEFEFDTRTRRCAAADVASGVLGGTHSVSPRVTVFKLQQNTLRSEFDASIIVTINFFNF